jgi:putative hydrolase of the HAD superfamily
MITTIIFDVGGVLVKGNSKYFFEKTAEYLGVEEPDMERKKDVWDDMQRGEIGLQDTIKEIYGIPISDEDMEKIIDIWGKNWELDEEMVEFAKNLKKNYRLFILSNVDRESIEKFKDLHLKRLNFVEEKFHSWKLGMIKPDREIYEYVLEKIGAEPEECVFIDDRPENIEGAEKVGIHGIVFKNREQLKNELKNLGVKVD